VSLLAGRFKVQLFTQYHTAKSVFS